MLSLLKQMQDPGGGVDNAGGCVYMGAERIWEISVHSSQFYVSLKLLKEEKLF